jgi:hypothetical protein
MILKIHLIRFRYTLASEMDDIHMGDTHLIAINDCTIDDEESCDQYVALIVAQHRNQFDFTALDSGMSIRFLIILYRKLFLISSQRSGQKCERTQSICSLTSYWRWF